MARWIHERSGLPQDRFIVINCAAIPTDLLESELFGIQKGVATGVSERKGVFARADGGTLFLDEIGEMPEALQAKVLRALDSGEIFPVGAGNAKKVQVRIVSATAPTGRIKILQCRRVGANRDLQAAIAEGRFRQDLYHRLAAHHIALPTLSQRSEDIPTLVSTFYQQAVRDTDKNSPGITTRAMATLMQFHWPGNIRQLKFAMQRAVQLLEPGEPLNPPHGFAYVPHLPDELQPQTQSAADLALKTQLHRAEAAALRAALNATAGDIHQAGTLLDISRSSFYQKLKEHQIKPA